MQMLSPDIHIFFFVLSSSPFHSCIMFIETKHHTFPFFLIFILQEHHLIHFHSLKSKSRPYAILLSTYNLLIFPTFYKNFGHAAKANLSWYQISLFELYICPNESWLISVFIQCFHNLLFMTGAKSLQGNA